MACASNSHQGVVGLLDEGTGRRWVAHTVMGTGLELTNSTGTNI